MVGNPSQLGMLAALHLCNSSHDALLQATSTGQLNTILTYYDITDPPVQSDLTSIPIPVLKKAIAVLAKAGKAQVIGISEGEGVRFFS